MGTTAQKLNGLLNTKSAIKSAIQSKGITVGDIKFSEYAVKIQNIPTGINVSDTTATISDVLQGKEFYSSDGIKQQGTIAVIQSMSNPSVSIDATGKVIASYIIVSGYNSNIQYKSAELQLVTKQAETFQPNVSSIVISSGAYIIGDQVILGDENLKSQNIKSGVTIFGVTGTYQG